MRDLLASRLVAAGRYVIFHAGRECGEERCRIETAAAGGNGENPGLYRVDITEGPGGGVKILNQPFPPLGSSW